jgi:hypothetical protein
MAGIIYLIAADRVNKTGPPRRLRAVEAARSAPQLLPSFAAAHVGFLGFRGTRIYF